MQQALKLKLFHFTNSFQQILIEHLLCAFVLSADVREAPPVDGEETLE